MQGALFRLKLQIKGALFGSNFKYRVCSSVQTSSAGHALQLKIIVQDALCRSKSSAGHALQVKLKVQGALLRSKFNCSGCFFGQVKGALFRTKFKCRACSSGQTLSVGHGFHVQIDAPPLNPGHISKTLNRGRPRGGFNFWLH